MTYLRSLFLNFLVVFFVNRVIPGIEVGSFEHVPNIGADLFFSLVVGFLNATIFPALLIFGLKPTLKKMGILSFIISFGAFALISAISFGVQVTSFGGYLIGSLIVWAVAFFSNYLEWKHSYIR